MTICLRWRPIALAVVLLTGLHTSPVFAGAVNPQNCGCRADPKSGGGYCWGTLQCFRQLPDPAAFAYILPQYLSSYQQVNFGAWFNNQFYQCWVTDQNRVPVALSVIAGLGPRNGFWVWWDRSGVCQQIYVGHDSEDF
jgi:hypothetical protein